MSPLRQTIEGESTYRLRLQLTSARRIESREEPRSIAARYGIVLEAVGGDVFKAHLAGVEPPLAGGLEDVVIRTVYLRVYDRGPGTLTA